MALGLYRALNVPTNDTDPVGGDYDPAGQILGVAVGELMPKGTYDVGGGSDKTWYYSAHIRNDSLTDDFNDGEIWLPNALAAWVADGVLSYVSDSSSDDSSVSIKATGFAPSGAAQTETTALNGTSSVNTSANWKAGTRLKLELVDSATGAAVNAVGTITISRGSVLGYIPAPMGAPGSETEFGFASSEYDIGLAASINTTLQMANRLTPPTGITFYRPATQGTSLAFPATLTPGDKLQVWFKWTGAAGMGKTAESNVKPWCQGTD